MWWVREKELELDDRLRGRSRYDGNSSKNHRDVGNVFRSTSQRHSINENDTNMPSSSSKIVGSSCSREDEGLRDEEVEEFLHSRSLENFYPLSQTHFIPQISFVTLFKISQEKKRKRKAKPRWFDMNIFVYHRVKRGRGAVGSRMDDTGPYLAPCPDPDEKLSRNLDAKLQRVVFGPEKPSSLKSYESSEEELDKDRLKKEKKVCSKSRDKKHSRKHRSKERSRDKKRKRKDEKRSKH
jgi:hypothetical protein